MLGTRSRRCTSAKSVSRRRAFKLSREFECIYMGDSEKITEFALKLTTMVNEIHALGIPMWRRALSWRSSYAPSLTNSYQCALAVTQSLVFIAGWRSQFSVFSISVQHQWQSCISVTSYQIRIKGDEEMRKSCRSQAAPKDKSSVLLSRLAFQACLCSPGISLRTQTPVVLTC